QAAWDKTMRDGAAELLDAVIGIVEAVEWAAGPLKEAFDQWADEREIKRVKLQMPVRVAVTGRTVGPPLFESLEALGRERAVDRIREARARV
ncbi:MAG TPA: glutamate--tRNA ligase, partial [Acidimicrobiales bacterium]